MFYIAVGKSIDLNPTDTKSTNKSSISPPLSLCTSSRYLFDDTFNFKARMFTGLEFSNLLHSWSILHFPVTRSYTLLYTLLFFVSYHSLLGLFFILFSFFFLIFDFFDLI